MTTKEQLEKEKAELKAELDELKARLAKANNDYDKFNGLLQQEGLSDALKQEYKEERAAVERIIDLLTKQRDPLLARFTEVEKLLGKFETKEVGIQAELTIHLGTMKNQKRVLVPATDDEFSVGRFLKKAIPTMGGSLQSVLTLDPSDTLERNVIALGAKLNNQSNNTEKILFRRCYMSSITNYILPRLESKDVPFVMVGGAPGIGKSVLGMLLSVTLMQHRKKIVLYQHFSSRLLLASSDCDPEAYARVFKLLESFGVDASDFDIHKFNVFTIRDTDLFEALCQAADTVFIQDIGEAESSVVAVPGKPFVLITSPNTARIKAVLKERFYEPVFLPPWSEEELQQANQLCFNSKYSPEKIHERFSKFGGIIRSVIDVQEGFTADEAYQAAIDGCTLESLSETMRSPYEKLTKGPISSILVHAVPKDANPDSSGVSSKSQNKFASVETRDKLANKFLKHSKLKAAEFAHIVQNVPELASFVGKYLENNFHEKVSEREFMIRSLTDTTAQRRKIRMPSLRHLPFNRDDFKDIMTFEENAYYQPCSTNFPTMDSFTLVPASVIFGVGAQGVVLLIFQVTKSPVHDLKGVYVKRLQDRLGDLGFEFSNTVFCWVSSAGGITAAQTVQGIKPRMEQWLLEFGDEYNDLFHQVLHAPVVSDV